MGVRKGTRPRQKHAEETEKSNYSGEIRRLFGIVGGEGEGRREKSMGGGRSAQKEREGRSNCGTLLYWSGKGRVVG